MIEAVTAVWTSWTALRTASAPHSASATALPRARSLALGLVGKELGQQVDRMQQGNQRRGPRIGLGARHHRGTHPVEDLPLGLGTGQRPRVGGEQAKHLAALVREDTFRDEVVEHRGLETPGSVLPGAHPTDPADRVLGFAVVGQVSHLGEAFVRHGPASADQPAGLELGIARFGESQRPVEGQVDDRGAGHGGLELGAVDKRPARGIAQCEQQELDGQRSRRHRPTLVFAGVARGLLVPSNRGPHHRQPGRAP